MIEYVDHKNYRKYMKIFKKCLKGDVLFLLHTIGVKYIYVGSDPWLTKFIFPQGELPSIN
jgi:cyclopropane-fatty-acyl-phospholipid synthase